MVKSVTATITGPGNTNEVRFTVSASFSASGCTPGRTLTCVLQLQGCNHFEGAPAGTAVVGDDGKASKTVSFQSTFRGSCQRMTITATGGCDGESGVDTRNIMVVNDN